MIYIPDPTAEPPPPPHGNPSSSTSAAVRQSTQPTDRQAQKYDVNYDNNPLGPIPRPPHGPVLTVNPGKKKAPIVGPGREEQIQSDVIAFGFLGSFPGGPRITDSSPSTSLGGPGKYDTNSDVTGRPPTQDLTMQDEETVNALDRLFHTGPDLERDEEDGTIPIDPTLADAPLAYTPEELGETRTDEDELTSPRLQKKKATSRANMLARGGACNFCKRRKLKCSAEMPSCAACTRAGKECVYAQKKQRSRVRVLEDRLLDLEKRLDKNHQDGTGDSALENFSSHTTGQAAYISPATTEDTPSRAATTEDWNQLFAPPLSTVDTGFSFPGLDSLTEDQRLEPDLMTLADAAASDNGHSATTPVVPYPWEGMVAEAIAAEIIRAVSGTKGMGEKIVAHLLQLYISSPALPHLHNAVSPSTLLSRLTTGHPSPPHPALILSIIPLTLPLSASPSLSSVQSRNGLIPLLRPALRAHCSLASTSADPRLLDIVAAEAIACLISYTHARFLEGWAESSGGASLAWACGLGKLGGVGERLVGRGGADRERRMEMERRSRAFKRKGALVPPPVDSRELKERILLFWEIFTLDKCSALGWGFPASISDEEVTTPWPHKDYDDPNVVADNRSMADLIGGMANTGRTDTDFCAQMKALTLLYRCNRLGDQPLPYSSPARTAELLLVTRNYMASLCPVDSDSYDQGGSKIGPWCTAWMMLHGALMFLYVKEEMDTDTGADRGILIKAVQEAEKIVSYLDLSYVHGDVDLKGYDIMAVGVWQAVAHAMYRLPFRGDISGTTDIEERMRGIGGRLVAACKTVGKRIPYGMVMAQLVENAASGQEFKVGEFERPDNVDW